MISKLADRQDAHVRKILDTPRKHYLPKHPGARVDAYRYNPGSIRLRILDPDVEDTLLTERDIPVWDVLSEHLPEEVHGEINMLLILTPKESKRSIGNMEFENPSPMTLA